MNIDTTIETEAEVKNGSKRLIFACIAIVLQTALKSPPTQS